MEKVLQSFKRSNIGQLLCIFFNMQSFKEARFDSSYFLFKTCKADVSVSSYFFYFYFLNMKLSNSGWYSIHQVAFYHETFQLLLTFLIVSSLIVNLIARPMARLTLKMLNEDGQKELLGMIYNCFFFGNCFCLLKWHSKAELWKIVISSHNNLY